MGMGIQLLSGEQGWSNMIQLYFTQMDGIITFAGESDGCTFDQHGKQQPRGKCRKYFDTPLKINVELQNHTGK